ncbi:tetratricopeptide repeat protein [Hymenobacter cellulosivorans]|uniref:Tetratricopeptide repeat protein n=1 Tax=Hymenobacter cellulosivorans TaxID=2932249 RepID=A0ABY4FBM1_9BACT|nr:tetratricopeptide repeat protein [Hymenobacter cellulosivorans]UOQ54066.1 tetratricopeptide repeat protein [Hymenobacter cellulosivorans]
MRFSLLLAAALLAAPGLRAQTTAPKSTPDLLARAQQLVQAKQYESAYQLLDQADPKNQQPAVLLAKEKLILDNYLVSIGHRMFGLQNLKPSQTVAQLRGKEGNYSMHPLDLPLELNRLQRKFPTDYTLAKGLGDYYYQVQQCHCGEKDKNDEQLLDLVLRYYNSAHAHGLGDYMSYYAVGYANLVREQAAPSVVPFEKSIALNPQYPTSHYNLAYALMQLKRPAEALPQARLAFDLYTDAELKADAARMLGHLYQQQKQPGEAQKAYQQSLALQPDSYPTLRALLALAVPTHQPEAPKLAAELFRLNPANDEMYEDIMDIYQASNQWKEVEAFFQSQLPTAPKEPIPQGLLHFYLAILNMQLEQPKAARPHFIEAQKHLSKVASPDNPMFTTIKKGLDATK